MFNVSFNSPLRCQLILNTAVAVATTYGAIKRTAQYIQDTHPFVTISSFQILFPASPASITEGFKAHLKALERKEGGKVYAIIDALNSNPGILLPWEELVKICKEENVWSVVDAEHAIGHQVDINLEQVQPDFWVTVSIHICRLQHVVERRNRIVINGSIPKEDRRCSTFQSGTCRTS